MNKRARLVAALLAAAPLTAFAADPSLHLSLDKATAKVSPTLYGLMTEEINFSYDGGLYGELIRNRNFKGDWRTPTTAPSRTGPSTKPTASSPTSRWTSPRHLTTRCPSRSNLTHQRSHPIKPSRSSTTATGVFRSVPLPLTKPPSP